MRDLLLRFSLCAGLVLAGAPALAAPYAIVDGSGHVVNIVEWDGKSQWAPPTGDTAVAVGSSGAGIGWTFSGGQFVAPPAPPAAAPTPDQLYTQALSAGIQIVSTATPALNGTYAIDSATQPLITGVVTSINAGKGLPGNQPVLPWADLAGNPHNFGATDFVNFAKAVEDYIFALSQTRALLKAGQQASWPAQPVTIP